MQRPDEDHRPLCIGHGDLFDSQDPEDHRVAKAMCLRCPVLEWCRGEYERAKQNTQLKSDGPQGTWAGEYIGHAGKPGRPRQPRAACGTPSGYKRHQREGTPKCEPCKRAHAWVVLCRKQRKQREAAS